MDSNGMDGGISTQRDRRTHAFGDGVNKTDTATKPRCKRSWFAVGMAVTVMVLSSEREPEPATAMTDLVGVI